MDVISAILGLPEEDRPMLRHHSDQILVREDGSMHMPAEAIEGLFALLGYFVEDLARRRTDRGTA